MRIFIISDLEGVNGVLNLRDWCVADGLRNEAACNNLTEELNAAVDGFFAGGASEVIILDGHGACGSVRGEKLDPRAALQRGVQSYPIMNKNVDAIAFVGAHAKAGTANAHLAHTQTEEAIDFRLNGISIGETGQSIYAYSELNVPAIFASGDLAMTLEIKKLVPQIFTVAVKEGFNQALDKTCSADDVFIRESAAVHYPRGKVLSDIRQQAQLAAEKFKSAPRSFELAPLPAPGKYIAEAEYRATNKKLAEAIGFYPARSIKTAVHDTICGALHEFYTQREWCNIDGKFIKELQ